MTFLHKLCNYSVNILWASSELIANNANNSSVGGGLLQDLSSGY